MAVTQVWRLTTTDVLLLGICVFLVCRLIQKTLSRSKEVRPPGPKGRWLVGNAYEIPKDRQWLKFDEWVREYGTPHIFSSASSPHR